jgi:hypothetical protein
MAWPIGELKVTLDIKPHGRSTVSYSAPWGSPSGSVGGVGFICDIREDILNLWIWHQVGNDGLKKISVIWVGWAKLACPPCTGGHVVPPLPTLPPGSAPQPHYY